MEPVIIGAEALPSDPAEIIYLTKYLGKVDSGIAFADQFYLAGLARSPLSTLVVANRLPAALPEVPIDYTSDPIAYQRQLPLLQISNGLGSFHAHLKGGYLPEHHASFKIAIIHDEPSAYDFYRTPIWNLDNVANRLMAAQDALIFVSRASQEQWNRFPHLAERPQFYLPNTCAEEPLIQAEFSSRPKIDAATGLGYDPNEIHLVVVGTVQPRKDQLTAVRALRILADQDPARRYRLHLVGRVTSPEYLAEIQAQAAMDGTTAAIEVVGAVEKQTALHHIHAADLLLLPSASEAMPLVLLEAMQLRTPILTTAVGGIREVLDEETAAFFDVSDADGLAAQVRAALDQPGPTSTRVAAAEARYWSEFSNQRFAERFDVVLAGVVALALPHGHVPGCHLSDSGLLWEPADEAAVRRLQRLWLARELPAEVRHARVRTPGGFTALLTAAAPLVRAGFRITAVTHQELALERGDGPALVSRAELAGLIHARSFVAAHESQTQRRAAAVSRRRQRETTTVRSLVRSRRWRLLSRALRPLDRLRARLRQSRKAESVPATVMIFNSPLQLVAALALWDQRYRPSRPGPLVAAIYSTNGAREFSTRLSELCRQTGRFDAVVDITRTYRTAYAGPPTQERFAGFRNGLQRALAGYRAETVFIAAFMSARGQKMIYECFPDARIRLFDDGLSSYLPKPIKVSHQGLSDRIGSGDCAEAHHISRITSVDLMLDLPAPPQYDGDLPGVHYPSLSTGAYAIDWQGVTSQFGVTPRPFATDEVLLVTQNFHDHLRGRGLSLADERGINDQVIASLLADGFHVTIRPHPRASTEVWGEGWLANPKVRVWATDPAIPVEALLDSDAAPALVVGASSSCLFYLADRFPESIRCYPDALLAPLRSVATREFEDQLDLAAGRLAPLHLRHL